MRHLIKTTSFNSLTPDSAQRLCAIASAREVPPNAVAATAHGAVAAAAGETASIWRSASPWAKVQLAPFVQVPA